MKDYWRPQDKSFRLGGDFSSKAGMCRNAFDNVRKKNSYGPKASNEKSFDDFRVLQDYYNKNMQDAFEAGAHLVVDESTSGWKGANE